jgi:hypothetical protein
MEVNKRSDFEVVLLSEKTREVSYKFPKHTLLIFSIINVIQNLMQLTLSWYIYDIGWLIIA